MQGVFYFFSDFFSFFYEGLLIFLFLIITSVFSALSIVFNSLNINAKKFNLLYKIISFSLISFSMAIYFFSGNKNYIAISLLELFYSLILYIPIIFLIDKKRKIKDEEKKLIDLLDDKIKEENVFKRKVEEVLPLPEKFVELKNAIGDVKTVKLTEKKEAEEKEADFSHVKEILEKLKDYSLTQAEKKQVDNLKTVLYEEENSVTSRNKINEGLNVILKIMSKYHI